MPTDITETLEMEVITTVPYCPTCKKIDIEALKNPHPHILCCGDIYYSHVLENGEYFYDEYNMNTIGTDDNGNWKENYHEFTEFKEVRIKGTIEVLEATEEEKEKLQ